MEDMERYGDYDEIDDEPSGHSPVGLIIKIILAVVCLSVAGIVGFRIITFNSYPKEVSRLIYSDSLADYYEATDGNIGAVTQEIGIVRYDDSKEGNFFFDKLVIVPDADHLQVTVRYNTSLMETIKTKYGVTLDPDADPLELFDFKLTRMQDGYVPTGDAGEVIPTVSVGEIGATETASSLMYRYVRLAFDGVEFGLGEGEEPSGWYRLEITIKGVDAPAYLLPVYSPDREFSDYNLSRDEVPNR